MGDASPAYEGDGVVLHAGAPPGDAAAAAILVHGRGATADGMIELSRHFFDARVAYLAPQAPARSWYPTSFLAPLAENAAGIASGMATLHRAMARCEEAGVPAGRILVIGFSQGACLALEFAARHARRVGGVIGWSGALIGNGERPDVAPPDDKTYIYPGSLEGTPVFLGCSDSDPHIPIARVHESAQVLEQLGGKVEKRVYAGMGHTVHPDEIRYVRELLQSVLD
jgi:phospholipase/carboxylesterase